MPKGSSMQPCWFQPDASSVCTAAGDCFSSASHSSPSPVPPCGLAAGTNGPIAAPIVQAIGAAVPTPASLALILGSSARKKRSAVAGM